MGEGFDGDCVGELEKKIMEGKRKKKENHPSPDALPDMLCGVSSPSIELFNVSLCLNFELSIIFLTQ